MIGFDLVKFGYCDDVSKLCLDDITPMNRRRMGSGAKFIHTAIKEFDDLNYPIIFASNSGEIKRCLALLSELSGENTVSPTSFSLSVLNAPVASVGIERSLHSPIFAISALASVESAFLSAFCKFDEFDRVCIICFEESAFEDEAACAAFLVQKGSSLQLELKESRGVFEVGSVSNFIRNFGKNFFFDDGRGAYEWKFDQIS